MHELQRENQLLNRITDKVSIGTAWPQGGYVYGQDQQQQGQQQQLPQGQMPHQQMQGQQQAPQGGPPGY